MLRTHLLAVPNERASAIQSLLTGPGQEWTLDREILKISCAMEFIFLSFAREFRESPKTNLWEIVQCYEPHLPASWLPRC